MIFLDNASIHRSKLVKEICEERGIPLLYNIAYRPDFNGIEGVWGYAKRIYSKYALSLRLDYDPAHWDNEAIVNECLKDVKPATASAFIAHGWKQLMAGQPIVPNMYSGAVERGYAARAAQRGAAIA